ncbi:MAG TPA: hypothetical protein ENK00_02270, partial [Chromatiales bacterium]|nr:hypothetical protein [Chromatiales bacterium]
MKVLICMAVCLALSIPAAFAERQPHALPWGITRLDLDGDGKKDLIVRSWRENHNAHGYAVYDLFVWKDGVLHRVLFPRKDGKWDLSFTSRQGADCVLRDLFPHKATKLQPAEIIVLNRIGAQGFNGQGRVQVLRYRIKHLREGLPGNPEFV